MLSAYLDYDPLVRIELGPLSVSPHGLGIGVGFVAGARLMLPAAKRRGITEAQVYALLTRAAIGAFIGARVAYVINHLGSFDNPLEWFEVWEGGISLLGGIAGGILAAVPKLRAERLSFWKTMDAAAPGLALGVAIGRIGDLIVADHLGKPTDFFLGYQCPGVDTASPCIAPVGQAVHQPALYDLVSATLLLGLLLWLRRRDRYDGFLILVFGAVYGVGRIVEDFFRIDVTHGTGLTGSQWTALVTVLACLYALAFLRRTPWASGQPAPGTGPETEAAHADEESEEPEESERPA
ncbi:MAG: prolipoprotein diacylglyceryl transferase [Acidimicrobiales bacterium]